MIRAVKILYLFVVAILAVATMLRDGEEIYNSWWFIALWGAMAALSSLIIVRDKMWRNLPRFLLHSSLLIILLGAAITYLYGERRVIHIRTGEVNHELPFSIKLESFEVLHYPGTTTPSDYLSRVSLDGDETQSISMNNILRRDGFRLYQTSFDKDYKGTYLSVNFDPYGIGVTYFGYALLALSMVLLLLSRRGRFRRLIATMSLLLFVVPSEAQTTVVSRASADSMSRRAVVYQGRVTPFNTVARDVVTKLYGEPTYNGLSAEQVTASIILHSEQWSREKIIKSGDRYLSLAELYDGTKYSPKEPDEKLDEKAAIIVMLMKGTLFKPTSHKIDKMRVEAELFYNRISSMSLIFKIHLGLGLLAFLLFIYTQITGRRFRWAQFLFMIQVCHSFGYLTLVLALRWYISGYVPMSNGYETMLFVSWILLGLAIIWRKVDMIPASALLLTGFTLLVSTFSTMNPAITSLMPVLVSPWLSSHVSLIMISYALFGLMMMNGVTALTLHFVMSDSRAIVHRLQRISQILLYPALFSLSAGIFLGAIWANVSWGRYWGWDPKEVWALITMMIYSILFHTSSLRFLRSVKVYHIFTILAMLTVLMTYFGVNYLLGGMHSYK